MANPITDVMIRGRRYLFYGKSYCFPERWVRDESYEPREAQERPRLREPPTQHYVLETPQFEIEEAPEWDVVERELLRLRLQARLAALRR